MLFNSPLFIFAFLPLTVGMFYVLAGRNVARALIWLTIASLFFYGWWRPFNILILAPSIALNFAIARFLVRYTDERPRWSAVLFWFGIAFNICFIGYFKYIDFGATLSNDLFGTQFVMQRVLLPLGVSFITFQKIALLVDARAGRVTEVPLRDYVLFVLFFPPLISGPIVHYREIMPQFAKLDGRFKWEDGAVGGSLFCFGLAKKMLIADPIAVQISPIWNAAAAGRHPSLLEAWAAALGFIVQLYFDFSGYSDMAIGVARLFGIRLPHNFNSPLRAASIIDYWARWHVTLTRFLTAYVFSPITLALTRARLAKDKQAMSGRRTRLSTFAILVAGPTLVTMFISGLWHGAGYQFLIFGMLHGVALVINHAWRTWKPKRADPKAPPPLWGYLLGWGITIVFAIFAKVFFRAADVHTALRMIGGMLGSQGVAVPAVFQGRFASLLAPLGIVVQTSGDGGANFVRTNILIAIAWLIALTLPNTHEMLAKYGPALDFRIVPGWRAIHLQWRPTMAWAIAMAVIALLCLMSLGQVSAFLYWQF